MSFEELLALWLVLTITVGYLGLVALQGPGVLAIRPACPIAT
jgi:hypothetical protein